MTNEEIALFFQTHPLHIVGNECLRLPQLEGYVALRTTLRTDDAPRRCYIQIPVGGGKTGLMSMTPFGNARGRVLIVTPDLTTLRSLKSEIDISNPDSFYVGRHVLQPPFVGPYVSEIRQDANLHDYCAAHIVVANIQQFASTRWFEQLPADFFRMILVDEGHHNIATSWQRLFDYFRNATVVSFTATPERRDGQLIDGRCVYRFGYAQSTLLGFVSRVEPVLISRPELSFTRSGSSTRLTLGSVRNMQEHEWLRYQVGLSRECNIALVDASLSKLREARRHAPCRQMVASACSRNHATQLQALYHERRASSLVVHGSMPEAERLDAYEKVKNGSVDVLVDAQAPDDSMRISSLSVAAIFRPYNSLASFLSSVQRVLPLADPMYPYAPTNKVYVVSHATLNGACNWIDLANADAQDREYLKTLLTSPLTGTARGQALDLFGGLTQHQEASLAETISTIVEQHRSSQHRPKGTHAGPSARALAVDDDASIERVLVNLHRAGFAPKDYGLDDDSVRQRLRQVTQDDQVSASYASTVQPQRHREGLRMVLHQQARTMTEIVLTRLGLAPNEKDLAGIYPDNAHMTNVQVVISHIQGRENAIMGVARGQRSEASVAQLQAALDAADEIEDWATVLLEGKLATKGGKDDRGSRRN